jgi:ankyrin repeat protein
LDSGASCNEVDDCGQTPLIRAIFVDQARSRVKIIRLLLKRGALVSKSDVVGRGAVSWACLYGRDFEVDVLLENADIDLDLNKLDINCQSALFHAVCSGNAACVKLMVQALRRYDMDVDIADCNGTSPLMQALKCGYDVCASILIHYGKAKMGLGMRFPRDFANAEKWAVQSLRDRGRLDPRKGSSCQFPPLTDPKINNKIRFHENRAMRYHVKTSADCDSDGDSLDFEDDVSSNTDDSIFSSGSESYMPTPLRHCLKITPRCGIPSSLLAISPTASMVVTTSCDEDEVDSFSHPLSDLGTGRSSCPDTDSVHSGESLHSLYQIYEQQMSASYRPTAAILVSNDVTVSVNDEVLSGSSDSIETPRIKAKNSKDSPGKDLMCVVNICNM